jgi:endoglucanase
MATPLTGCDATERHIAPGGYYTNGNTICTADGHSHLFHGVDRPSLEWQSGGDNLTAADFQLMASWKANVVRVALNQDFWLSGSKYYDAKYAGRVDSVIGFAEDAGLDVILDLHWSDKGTLGSCKPADGCQQLMADANSLTFWSDVAARYKNDGRVMFELYNEPHDVSWPFWKSGGTVSGGWQVVGMQQLYDAVRAAGADNLVVIGGLDWAFDLSGVPANRIGGYNILYATHPYDGAPERSQSHWTAAWGYLTQTDPVIVTEFGDISGACTSTFTAALIAYADLHAASWTAWAWYPGGCSFPSLITDWTGAPTAAGMVVKAALAGYHDPAPGGARDAGSAPDDGGSPDAADGGAPDEDGGGDAATESDGGAA